MNNAGCGQRILGSRLFLSGVLVLTMSLSANAVAQPSDAPLSVSQGIWRFRQGEYDEARRLFSDAVEQDTSNEQAHLWLARAWEKLGRQDEAEQVLIAASKALPESDELIYARASLLDGRGEHRAAATLYQQIAERHAGARSALASPRQSAPESSAPQSEIAATTATATLSKREWGSMVWGACLMAVAIVLFAFAFFVLVATTRIVRATSRTGRILVGSSGITPGNLERPPLGRSKTPNDTPLPRSPEPADAASEQEPPSASPPAPAAPPSDQRQRPTHNVSPHGGSPTAAQQERKPVQGPKPPREPPQARSRESAGPVRQQEPHRAPSKAPAAPPSDQGHKPADNASPHAGSPTARPQEPQPIQGPKPPRETPQARTTEPAGPVSQQEPHGVPSKAPAAPPSDQGQHPTDNTPPPAGSSTARPQEPQPIQGPKPPRETPQARTTEPAGPVSQQEPHGAPSKAPKALPSDQGQKPTDNASPHAGSPTARPQEPQPIQGPKPPRETPQARTTEPAGPVSQQEPHGAPSKAPKASPSDQGQQPADNASPRAGSPTARPQEPQPIQGPKPPRETAGPESKEPRDVVGEQEARRGTRESCREQSQARPYQPAGREFPAPNVSRRRRLRWWQSHTHGEAPSEFLLCDPAPSPDGGKLAFATPSALCVLNIQELSGLDSSSLDRFVPGLNTLPPECLLILRRGRFSRPVWSPDGRSIAVEEHEDEADAYTGARRHVGLLRADGSDYRRISPRHGWSGSPTWLSSRALLFVHADRPYSPTPGDDRYRRDDALLVYELAGNRLWTRRTRTPLATYDRVEWLPVMRMLAFCPLVYCGGGPVQVLEPQGNSGSDTPSLLLVNQVRIVKWRKGVLSREVTRGSEAGTTPRGVGCVRPTPDGLRAATALAIRSAVPPSSAQQIDAAVCAVQQGRVFALEQQRKLAAIEHARMPSWSADGKQLIFVSTKSREVHGETIVLADAADLSRSRVLCWTATDPAVDHPRPAYGNQLRRIWRKLAAAFRHLLQRTGLQPSGSLKR